MSRPHRSDDRLDALRSTGRTLRLLSSVVRYGLFAVGLGLVLDRTKTFFSDVQLTYGERFVLLVVLVSYGGGFAVAGWVAGRLFRAAEALLGLLVDRAEDARRTADLVELEVIPALGRIAHALERQAAAPPAPSPRDDGRAIALAGVRQAIDESRWDRAERLIGALRRDYPGIGEAGVLEAEVAEGRGRAVEDLTNRLEAAKAAGDPDQVIGYRDELTLHLRGDELKRLDRETIAWLMLLLQKRLRAGAVRSDVAALAARAAESFGDTPEGASLRASLPTLRRSAGLCPRCAKPYTGQADACPECLRNPTATRAARGPAQPERAP